MGEKGPRIWVRWLCDGEKEKVAQARVRIPATFIEHLLCAGTLLRTVHVPSWSILIVQLPELSAVCSLVHLLIHQDC